MQEKRLLAFDFGASSGRAITGSYDGQHLLLQEIHRFSNDPVTIQGHMYWDVLRLFYELKRGLSKARRSGQLASVGLDTWGVDFGLLDGYGQLMANPRHYRDVRNQGMSQKAFNLMDQEELYQITGNQVMDINTAFQLLAISQQQPQLFQNAKTLLFMPDLLNYFLTGIKQSEVSIASTSQLLDAQKRAWSNVVMDKLGLPRHLFTKLTPSGSVLGPILPGLQHELSLEAVPVTAVCGHDTQDALVSVPAREKDFIFISCGTWALFGTELDQPLINQQTAALNVTNECGYGGKISFLKNIIGLWLIQEARLQWQRDGQLYTYGELEQLAAAAKPFACFINPDDPIFVPAGNMPRRLQEYCARTGQNVPQTPGEMVRCIDESLALKYRSALEEIQSCTGKIYPVIYMVGGGTQSHLLCQMTASACQRPVCAGPVEATVYGNLMVQLLAMGELNNIGEARQLVQSLPELQQYEPTDSAAWEEAYARYKKLIRTAEPES